MSTPPASSEMEGNYSLLELLDQADAIKALLAQKEIESDEETWSGLAIPDEYVDCPSPESALSVILGWCALADRISSDYAAQLGPFCDGARHQFGVDASDSPRMYIFAIIVYQQGGEEIMFGAPALEAIRIGKQRFRVGFSGYSYMVRDLKSGVAQFSSSGEPEGRL